MGCGDASILILAVTEFGIKKAIGIESDPKRFGMARKNVERAELSDAITIEKKDMFDVDLKEADVIFAMLPEDKHDFEDLYDDNLKRGARLIKHDLPLIGYMPDRIDYPFYKSIWPFRKASSKNQWAAAALEKKNGTIDELWNDLYHYGCAKAYSKSDIRTFKRILSKRVKS